MKILKIPSRIVGILLAIAILLFCILFDEWLGTTLINWMKKN